MLVNVLLQAFVCASDLILSYSNILSIKSSQIIFYFAAEYVTLDMVISETMVGGLIGRAGSNISRIRTESGAMIKVCVLLEHAML